MLDILISFVALIIISPFALIIALKIKLGSEGPVIYRQKRVGYRRKEFILYKFRTMRVNAEQNGPALSRENDDRVTPFGHFMLQISYR